MQHQACIAVHHPKHSGNSARNSSSISSLLSHQFNPSFFFFSFAISDTIYIKLSCLLYFVYSSNNILSHPTTLIPLKHKKCTFQSPLFLLLTTPPTTFIKLSALKTNLRNLWNITPIILVLHLLSFSSQMLPTIHTSPTKCLLVSHHCSSIPTNKNHHCSSTHLLWDDLVIGCWSSRPDLKISKLCFDDGKSWKLT